MKLSTLLGTPICCEPILHQHLLHWIVMSTSLADISSNLDALLSFHANFLCQCIETSLQHVNKFQLLYLNARFRLLFLVVPMVQIAMKLTTLIGMSTYIKMVTMVLWILTWTNTNGPWGLGIQKWCTIITDNLFRLKAAKENPLAAIALWYSDEATSEPLEDIDGKEHKWHWPWNGFSL